MTRRLGLTLVEVLVALALVAIQVPAVFATISAAVTLTQRAQAVVADIDPGTAAARCEGP